MTYQHNIELDLQDYTKSGAFIDSESCALLFCESEFNPSTQDIETVFQVYFDNMKIEFDELTKVDQELILERVNNLTANETQKIIDYYYDEKQNYIPEVNQHD